jgi:hypothetical protein
MAAKILQTLSTFCSKFDALNTTKLIKILQSEKEVNAWFVLRAESVAAKEFKMLLGELGIQLCVKKMIFQLTKLFENQELTSYSIESFE